jgi:hypothetical protein
LILVALTSCIFDPKKDQPCTDCNQPPAYPKLSTPENVLSALQMSYQARDSVEFKLLYDVDYIGTSTDLATQETLPPFNREAEYRHIAALAKVPSITNVILQFPPVLVREHSLGDPPDWVTIQMQPNSGVRLEVYDGNNVYTIPSEKELLEFKFIPTTPDSTSPTDTTWKIVRWNEYRS